MDTEVVKCATAAYARVSMCNDISSYNDENSHDSDDDNGDNDNDNIYGISVPWESNIIYSYIWITEQLLKCSKQYANDALK